ncbi:hypothetical protein OPV22_014479 [Ensete ventricosum]|uniref:U1-type domain-containing protein n=1 Tax=Ensete ventricosum TaxID=4639 RepID=A0AAV8PKE3_ENSVE|nr:hypothetical protein OPV22_014479 [Ensete ventricosum]
MKRPASLSLGIGPKQKQSRRTLFPQPTDPAPNHRTLLLLSVSPSREMIKRRFYRQEHGGGGVASSDSSSSSDSDEDLEAQEEEDAEAIGGSKDDDDDDGEEEEEEEEREKRQEHPHHSPSSGSGYESEESSGNVVEGDSSGLLTNEENYVSENVGGNPKDSQLNAGVKTKDSTKVKTGSSSIDMNDPIQADFANYILKHKSVFKCRLCPRIVCLSEDTVKTHLKSKRHARSRKLLGEGRLRLMLNSNGEIEEDQETHSERHARTLALAEELNAAKKRDSGRQRQSLRRKMRLRNKGETEKRMDKPKKRSKTED